MRELGTAAADMHGHVARDAASRGLELVLFVGDFAQQMKEKFIQAGGKRDQVMACPDNHNAWSRLKSIIQPGDLILLKASRGVRLESLLHAIEQEFA